MLFGKYEIPAQDWARMQREMDDISRRTDEERRRLRDEQRQKFGPKRHPLVKWVERGEGNGMYRADKSFDGGGYSQPEITVQLDDGGTVSISDTSCGIFGRRYSAVYTSASGQELAWYRFDGVVQWPDPVTAGGNFGAYPDVAAAVKAVTGYDLLIDCG